MARNVEEWTSDHRVPSRTLILLQFRYHGFRIVQEVAR
jgi:hypothetical protein